MTPPNGSKTAQGYELQLGVNNLGPFLLTKLLTPTLARTARIEDPSSVRVAWVSSSAAEAIQVPSGGVDLSNLDYHVDKSPFDKYCVSKAGNYLQGAEFARRHKQDGIVSIPLNPGNLNSDLWRSFGSGAQGFLRTFVLHPPILGAYTQLFAAFSPQVTIERSGEWGKSLPLVRRLLQLSADDYAYPVAPWGRFMKIRQHLLDGSKPVSEGGKGTAEKFWEWNEEQVRPFS